MNTLNISLCEPKNVVSNLMLIIIIILEDLYNFHYLYNYTNIVSEYVFTVNTIPPMITEQPDKHITFVTDDSIELPCVATGEPSPTYV